MIRVLAIFSLGNGNQGKIKNPPYPRGTEDFLLRLMGRALIS